MKWYNMEIYLFLLLLEDVYKSIVAFWFTKEKKHAFKRVQNGNNKCQPNNEFVCLFKSL